MPDPAILGRLTSVSEQLRGLYLERPVVHLGYLNLRADATRRGFEAGATQKVAEAHGDFEARAAREMFETLEADIAALQEERDHLRLLLTLPD